MNVEMITTLEQVKSMLSRAYNVADRQLRNPFGDKESVSSYLLSKIQIVTNEIDAFISEEENAFEAYYSEDRSTNVNISVEDLIPPNPPLEKGVTFPLDDDSEIPEEGVVERIARLSVTLNPNTGKTGIPIKLAQAGGFNPLIHDCASDISEAFSDCWVSVKALKPNDSNPEYTISIQPSGYTPNDIQLKLRSLGYAPTFKKISDHAEYSAWVYFDVVKNGIAFELSSTVDEISPPDIERYDEPATDDELLPF